MTAFLSLAINCQSNANFCPPTDPRTPDFAQKSRRCKPGCAARNWNGRTCRAKDAKKTGVLSFAAFARKMPRHKISLVENSRGFRQSGFVRPTKFLALVLVAVFLAGCKKTETAAAPPEDSLPTQAQPKLPTVKLYLGAETLDAEQALTELQQRTGMMFRTNIQDADAMIFVFQGPFQVGFWMKNCPESISAAYISPDGVIQEIHHLEKNDTNTVLAAGDDIQYVLETSEGWFARHNVSTGAVVRTEKGSLAETFFQK
jgi:uncharacterized membrane protein (UPF0127 family)